MPGPKKCHAFCPLAGSSRCSACRRASAPASPAPAAPTRTTSPRGCWSRAWHDAVPSGEALAAAVDRLRVALQTVQGRHPFHNFTRRSVYRRSKHISRRGEAGVGPLGQRSFLCICFHFYLVSRTPRLTPPPRLPQRHALPSSKNVRVVTARRRQPNRRSPPPRKWRVWRMQVTMLPGRRG